MLLRLGEVHLFRLYPGTEDSEADGFGSAPKPPNKASSIAPDGFVHVHVNA